MRPVMLGREKWSWAAIFICLAVIEIRAVNHDREQQNDAFATIGTGITRAIQENAAHFDATMRGLDDLKTQVSIVRLAAQGSVKSGVAPDETRQIATEITEYINKGQPANLSNFSSPTLSVVANELADQLNSSYHHWVSEDKDLSENFAHRILATRSTDEKRRIGEQETAERIALRRRSASEFARILSDEYLICEEVLKRLPSTDVDRTFLARIHNSIQAAEVPDTQVDPLFVESCVLYLKQLARRISS